MQKNKIKLNCTSLAGNKQCFVFEFSHPITHQSDLIKLQYLYIILQSELWEKTRTLATCLLGQGVFD